MKRIGEAMRGISPEDVRRRVTKGARIEVRATVEEKDEITQVAAQFGLSVGEYLLTLHRFAVERLMHRR